MNQNSQNNDDVDEELHNLLSTRRPVEHQPEFWNKVSQGLNQPSSQSTPSRGLLRLEWAAVLLLVVAAGGGLFAISRGASTNEITSPSQGSQAVSQTTNQTDPDVSISETTAVEATQVPSIDASSTTATSEPDDDLEGVTIEAPDVVVSDYAVGVVLPDDHRSTLIGLEYPDRFTPFIENEILMPGELILAFERSPAPNREYLEVRISADASLEAAVQNLSGQTAIVNRFAVPVAEFDFGDNPPATNTVRITGATFEAAAVTLVDNVNQGKVTYVLVAHPEHIIQIEIQHSIDSSIAYDDLLAELLFFEGVG